MKMPGMGMLLRIFIGESDHVHGKPLYESIVLKAKELGLAGATVTKGVMGYGASTRMHTAKLVRLSDDLPIIIEIVDSNENIDKLIPFLDEHITDGLVTLEKVTVLKYRYRKK